MLSARRRFLTIVSTYYGLLYSNDMIPPWVKTDKPLKLYRDKEPIGHSVDQSTLREQFTIVRRSPAGGQGLRLRRLSCRIRR